MSSVERTPPDVEELETSARSERTKLQRSRWLWCSRWVSWLYAGVSMFI